MSSEAYISNWFSNMRLMDEPYVHNGISYKTSENFYQAMKISPFQMNKRIELSEMTAVDSKKAFRKFPNYYVIRGTWNTEEKLRVMKEVLDWKFKPGTSWHKLLMETGDDDIVEYNNWGDTFWGVTVKNNEGSNHLGKILMEIRNDFNRIKLDEFML